MLYGLVLNGRGDESLTGHSTHALPRYHLQLLFIDHTDTVSERVLLQQQERPGRAGELALCLSCASLRHLCALMPVPLSLLPFLPSTPCSLASLSNADAGLCCSDPLLR